jgi:hypothetical protein
MRIHVCSPQLSHLPFVCRLYHYVKEHRHTPFPFVDDAKVRTKKMRLKEFKRIMEVFRELWN